MVVCLASVAFKHKSCFRQNCWIAPLSPIDASFQSEFLELKVGITPTNQGPKSPQAHRP